MKLGLCVVTAAVLAVPAVAAESNLERGKRIVNECLEALGGDRFLNMRDRIETGRAYSFYREQVSGLSIAKICTRYKSTVEDTANTLAVEEREYFGKKFDSSVLFGQNEAFELTFRGARPIPEERFARYKETTIRDVFYILRIRLKEKGMIFDARRADVVDNRPVEIVDIVDADNRVTTVYFDQTTKVPTREQFDRRNLETKEKDTEVTTFAKYRQVGGVQWPYDVHRERNGEKIYEMFSESCEMNKGITDDQFQVPGNVKVLKPVR
ncbi:MAG: hypothetical protein JO022_09050 [Acidobacteriaceae bacterium]|nr:hypothetical protein [Acidobacteriaceae bacterium]